MLTFFSSSLFKRRSSVPFSVLLLTLGVSFSAHSQTVIGVLNSETSSPDVPASVQPLFQLSDGKWSAVSTKKCKKIEVNEWQMMFEGEAGEKLKSNPERSEQDHKKCRFPVAEVPALKRPQVIVSSDAEHVSDPNEWTLVKLLPKEIMKLPIPKDMALVKAYRNKDKDQFFVMQTKITGKTKKMKFLSGFWDSSKKKIWSTTKQHMDFLEAGDFDGDGASEIILIEGAPGKSRKYLLFSSSFKNLAEKKR